VQDLLLVIKRQTGDPAEELVRARRKMMFSQYQGCSRSSVEIRSGTCSDVFLPVQLLQDGRLAIGHDCRNGMRDRRPLNLGYVLGLRLSSSGCARGVIKQIKEAQAHCYFLFSAVPVLVLHYYSELLRGKAIVDL
jgi:hypothetical protein